MGDLDFRMYWTKIDHFQGLSGPLEGQGGARESKNGPKRGSKRGQKGSKMAILARFRPFFNGFQPTWISGCTLKFSSPCVEVWSSRKKFGVGILRYEGSKSGIFETFPETQRTKVTGQVRCPDSGFDHIFFLVIFWIRCHLADPPQG